MEQMCAGMKNMFLFSVINITCQVMGRNAEHTSLSFSGMVHFKLFVQLVKVPANTAVLADVMSVNAWTSLLSLAVLLNSFQVLQRLRQVWCHWVVHSY